MLRQLVAEQKRPHIVMFHKHVIQDISTTCEVLEEAIGGVGGAHSIDEPLIRQAVGEKGLCFNHD